MLSCFFCTTHCATNHDCPLIPAKPAATARTRHRLYLADGRFVLVPPQAAQLLGWRVLIVWECELKKANRGATLAKLTADILQQEMAWEYLQAA